MGTVLQDQVQSEVRICSGCLLPKDPASDFYASRPSRCKDCVRALVKANRDRDGGAANRERCRRRFRGLTPAQREAERTRLRAYRSTPLAKATWASWYAANSEQVRERVREWTQAHPEVVRRNAVAATRRRRARLRCVQTLPFTVEQLAAKWAYWGDRCWMCGATGRLEADHVKPLALGGPHILANLRPACRSCNASKAARWEGTP